MAVIVVHKKTKARFILVGTGYGAYKSHKSHNSWDFPVDKVEEGKFPLMCICDSKGGIGWVRTSEMEVITVDGKEPWELLGYDKPKPQKKQVPRIPKTTESSGDD